MRVLVLAVWAIVALAMPGVAQVQDPPIAVTNIAATPQHAGGTLVTIRAAEPVRYSTFRLGETSPADVDLWSSEGLETYLYKATAEYKPFTRDEKVIPTIKFTEEENDELAVLRVELANAIKEGVIGFMTGARDVDADYDAFLAELEGKGLPRLIELHQTQYDAQYAAK